MAAKVDKYPIPNIDDLYKLSGGKVYSKLDLSHAYLQLRLDDESQKLTTINTTKGLFVYTRFTIWGIFSTKSVPEDHGSAPTRHTDDSHIPR